MPISANVKTAISTLKVARDGMFFKRWIFPKSVSRALESFNVDQDVSLIVDAFLNHTSAFQRRFINCLQNFSHSDLMRYIELARNGGLPLSPEIINTIASHQDPIYLLTSLTELDLLRGDAAKANFLAMAGHQLFALAINPSLQILKKSGLLRGVAAHANFEAVARHPYAYDINYAIQTLNKNGLLSDETAQENFKAVASHKSATHASFSLLILNKAGLLSKPNRDAIAGHQDPESVADALITLNAEGLLTSDAAQAYRNAISEHQDPRSLAYALVILNRAGLLTGHEEQTNRNHLTGAGQDDLPFIGKVLYALSKEGLLTEKTKAQTNFNNLMTYLPILKSLPNTSIWQAADGTLTQILFDKIINLCHQHANKVEEDRRGLLSHINQKLLGLPSEDQTPLANWGIFTANGSRCSPIETHLAPENSHIGNSLC